MKLLALLTPAAMLAVLWALERLEFWINHTPGHVHRRTSPRLWYFQRAAPRRAG